MTHTEQDKELEKAVWASLASQMTHAINCTDPEHKRQDSCVDFTEKNFEQLMQLITEETVKARVEEINRIDEANKDNGINFFFEDMKPQNNGWRNMRQYVPDRIAQLKAELKQSNNKDT